MIRLSTLLSATFYPMLTPLYAFFFSIYLLPPLHQPFDPYILFFVALVGLYALLPILLILLLKHFHGIDSLSLITRRERIRVLLGTASLYILPTYLFDLYAPLHPILLAALFASTLLLFLLSLCTLFLKISIHAATMSAWVGYWLFLFQAFPQYNFLVPVIVCTVLTGAVLSARLHLRAHSPQEIYAGTAVGFAVFYLTLTFAS